MHIVGSFLIKRDTYNSVTRLHHRGTEDDITGSHKPFLRIPIPVLAFKVNLALDMRSLIPEISVS